MSLICVPQLTSLPLSFSLLTLIIMVTLATQGTEGALLDL